VKRTAPAKIQNTSESTASASVRMKRMIRFARAGRYGWRSRVNASVLWFSFDAMRVLNPIQKTASAKGMRSFQNLRNNNLPSWAILAHKMRHSKVEHASQCSTPARLERRASRRCLHAWISAGQNAKSQWLIRKTMTKVILAVTNAKTNTK
jgi:hypothetical protein